MAASLPLVRVLESACIFAVLAACTSERLRDREAPGAARGGEAAEREPSDPVTIQLFDRVRVASDDAAEHRREAFVDVDFGGGEVSSARLRLRLESPCFPFEAWREQEIPAGQRWPVACDAFDRKVSISIDDPTPGSDALASPGLELLRAITPFGGPLELITDITDVTNHRPGPHRLRLAIDTWSDPEGRVSGANGEWRVSLDLERTPGPAPRHVLAVTSLVFGDQLESEVQPVKFKVPKGVGSARIDYRVTGHGGEPDALCRGPAEEFCERTHELAIDDEPLPPFVPWRSDCATLCTLTNNDAPLGPAQYCAENPCGAPASVRAPRANWCPGSATEPITIEAPVLSEPGEHELTRRIRDLKPNGFWTVSATYFAYE